MDVVRKKGKPKKIKTKTETIDNPTTKIPEQQIITARNFYNMGMDAEFAFKQPGTPGRDSCQKLWRFWDNELRDSYNMDINDRQVLAKQRMGESYKRLLFKLEIQLNQYETAINSHFDQWQANANILLAQDKANKISPYKPNDIHQRIKMALIESIINCRDRMTALEIASTVDERGEMEILKHLQAKADRYAEIDAQFREKEARSRDLVRKQNIPRKLHRSKNIDELTEFDSDSESFDSKDAEL